MSQRGWIGVDLDGTLAEYHGWRGEEHIGAPIPAMLARVRNWLEEGREVRIFTARVCRDHELMDDGLGCLPSCELCRVLETLNRWMTTHLGRALPVTNKKDYGMIELWDDRCVQVVTNTGERVGP